jgi:UDP-2,4-diacetamido-2,4,6-trideoxy-beta-L-altropyranose hydrolase
MLNVLFRVDGSISLGTGHVVRCITLAQSLSAHGIKSSFLCWDYDGRMISYIESSGFPAYRLDFGRNGEQVPDHIANKVSCYSTQQKDARNCIEIAKKLDIGVVLVDHYSLDISWEKEVKPYVKKLIVLDDLANRRHDCDLLIDQNLGRKPSDYDGLLIQDCKKLIGPKYSLVRSEFSRMRISSLSRKDRNEIRHILVTLGGADNANATMDVLKALNSCDLGKDTTITIVLGKMAPWKKEISAYLANYRWKNNLIIDASNMEALMCQADFCIGAAGSTVWELCTLGLPSILVCVAENQKEVIKHVCDAGAAVSITLDEIINYKSINVLNERISWLREHIRDLESQSKKITDGNGSNRVSNSIMEIL